MKTNFIKSIILMAIMTLSLSAFGQSPPANPSIYVSIPKNGCVCPDSGVGTSVWYWIKNNYPNPSEYQVCAGTSFIYHVPGGGYTSSTQTYSGYTPYTVTVTIIPDGGAGTASKTVNYPGPCEIRPGSCCPPLVIASWMCIKLSEDCSKGASLVLSPLSDGLDEALFERSFSH